MNVPVVAIGLLLAAVALVALLRPATVLDRLPSLLRGPWLYLLALLRLLLGAGLIGAAQRSPLPPIVEAAGWLLVLAALVIVVVPAPVLRRRARQFAAWPPWAVSLCLCGPLLLGVLLVIAGR